MTWLKKFKPWLLPHFEKLQIASVKNAVREQGLFDLVEQLKKIKPDEALIDQYTTFKIENEVSRVRMRSKHAFQIQLALSAIQRTSLDQLTLVDIGDSNGTHLEYLNGIHSKNHKRLRNVSVNLDPEAVQRIQNKGLEAILCRAEDLTDHHIDADIFFCFETLEHLSDPITFLKSMAQKTACRFFVLTVPYVTQSRLGLLHIRRGEKKNVCPENTHIFELSPSDLKLLFHHAGWRIVEEVKYLQYPRRHPLRLMRKVWRWFDFEGFYGVILEKDPTWSSLYKEN